MPRLRLLPVLALPAVMLAAPAMAETRPGILDLLTGENLLRFAVQAGVTALRSQMDFQYDHILPDVAAGQVTLTGIRGWPRAPWPGPGCGFAADSATVGLSNGPDWDHSGLRIDMTGLSVQPGCLPPDARRVLAETGLDTIAVAQAYLTIDYRPSSAAASVALHLDSPALATVDATANFSYVALDASKGGPDPVPVVWLSDARLEMEDHGAWELASPLLPLPVRDPAAAAEALELGLRQAMAQGSATLSAEQEAFVTSARTEVARFLASGDRIAIETSVLNGEVLLEQRLLDNPRELFRVLRPGVLSRSVTRPALLDPAMLESALATDGTSSPEARLTVGIALISGVGVPQSVDLGRALLTPLADAGDSSAALALAQALEVQAPDAAYRYALIAAAAGETGGLALVDGIEAGLDITRTLAIQAEVSAGERLPDAPFETLAGVRDAALARMTGAAATRSYARAWFWASIGAAAGDPASISLRDQIDRRIRAHGPDAAAAWDAVVQPVAEAALGNWINRDLAALYAPK